MEISKLSTHLAKANLRQAVALNVFSMVKDAAVQQSQDVVHMMQQSVQSHLGRSMDFKV